MKVKHVINDRIKSKRLNGIWCISVTPPIPFHISLALKCGQLNAILSFCVSATWI